MFYVILTAYHSMLASPKMVYGTGLPATLPPRDQTSSQIDKSTSGKSPTSGLIRFAGKALVVKTKPIAKTVNESAHLHLWNGIFRLHRAHVCATFRINRPFGHSPRN